MLEELTPKALAIFVFIVASPAPVITLLVSAFFLWRYRRAVARQMALTGGFEADAAVGDGLGLRRPQTAANAAHATPGADTALLAKIHAAHRREVLGYVLAGAAFALTLAIAAHQVYKYRLGLPGFLLGMWIYLWPVALTMLLIVSASMRRRVAYLGGYFVAFALLTLWASTVHDIAPIQFGAISLPARSSATPLLTLRLWLTVNGPPTVLMLLCFNRWVRAVAPLVLAIVTMALAGALLAFFVLATPRGQEAAVSLALATRIHVFWLVPGLLLASLTLFASLGWVLARWIARAYRRRTVDDQSLMLDALWLLFATFYGMWLVQGGLIWTLAAPVAFVVYKLAVMLTHRLTREATRQVPRGLTFLRVFALGRRSERLLETISRYWRHVGSVQMITGPDVARSTIQPHQFLDFMSRRLATHFVSDTQSLAQMLAQWDYAPGFYGRYKVNNFFCHADSWRHVLPHLVRPDDAVLMDLRGFTQRNDGCIHELEHLVATVPLERCVLLFDESTDFTFLQCTLARAFGSLPANAANSRRSPEEMPLVRAGAGVRGLQPLVRRLCQASIAATTVRQ